MDKTLSDKFTNCVNDLLDYISIFSITKPDDTVHTLETTRMELDSAWDQVKRAYIDCRDYVPEEEGKPIDKNKLRKHYMDTMGSYKKALSSINGQIQNLLDEKTQEKMKRESEMSQQGREVDFTNVSRLPPCDTDTFKGGYREWPTFRDLFSAIYINNSKLSNVEKLFHLTQKTVGEAREIISHVPLTNDGFTLAWKNLTDRYENIFLKYGDLVLLFLCIKLIIEVSSKIIGVLQN